MIYNILLIVLGIAILAVAWLPYSIQRYPLSYPILFVLFGIFVFWLPLDLPTPNPMANQSFTTHLTEICVIVALTGTGLKIDKPYSFRGWRIPVRLATLMMIATIGLLAVAAWSIAGLTPAAAVLLAATLAPTDPVLAGDVQVAGPGKGDEDNVRFALTGEGGLNDGLAFPFVYLALAIFPPFDSLQEQLNYWFFKDIIYRLCLGILGGYLSGKLLGYLIFGLPKKIRIEPESYGFVVIAITFCAYGLTELVEGYGFLAVFIAAVTVRDYERTHEYHQIMHSFADQIERLLNVIVLILFGGAIGRGLLDALTWEGAAVGLLLLLVVRPLTGWLTLIGTKTTWRERWVIAGFGIRGVGSFFYLAFGIEKAGFAEAETLWAITGFTVLVSIFLHGTLATPVMNWLDRRQIRTPAGKYQQHRPDERTT
ncbi:cation:proton antiporter [Nibrella saemangeumensis]|uniref:Cation:proton antiporter n=1 Tax=Nibrella saemangeumensis TaxID=1084526 RepID=A0ABP8NT42_9BACT